MIPTLNAAAGLPRALESLEPGRARIAEIVVADGGSTDGTRAAAKAGLVKAGGFGAAGEEAEGET